MNLRALLLALLTLGLSACGDGAALPLTGTLERDRMELVAEAQEPIVQIAVHEGDRVKAGDLILQLDTRDVTSQVTQAQSARDQAAAKLPGVDASFTRAQKDFDRIQALVQAHTSTASQLDQARANLDNARADRNMAAAALAQTQAALDQAKITLDRLSVRAPRDANVDSLPYHLGERPPTRAVVAVLLDASAAYVQVYIPEPLRTRALVGTEATLKFDGLDKTYSGTLRYVSQDASFTPYYSLTERDRSRLAYLAKVYLQPGDAGTLPNGVPVSVDFPEPAPLNTVTQDYAIQARGLTRRFGKFTAVDGVDLRIPRAQIYGFLGPNGAGKSTTIRMLCGLLEPSSGEVEVLGYRVPEQAEALRRKLGYMTQSFSLYTDLTVRENLEFMAEVFTLSKTQRAARIHQAEQRYFLGDLMGQRAGTLSGGQKQRLALAAATLHGPEMLFLDEPTSAVDPQSRRDFWDRLFDLAAEGTTILVSTHLMDEAERCHGLAIINHGKLVAEGSPQALMDGIDALVLEIESPDPRHCAALLSQQPYVKSVTQLGTRLHALLDKRTQGGLKRVQELLKSMGPGCLVRETPANLEDVFVAATGPGSGDRHAA